MEPKKVVFKAAPHDFEPITIEFQPWSLEEIMNTDNAVLEEIAKNEAITLFQTLVDTLPRATINCLVALARSFEAR